LAELQAELLKRAERYSLPNPFHSVKVKVEVVNGVQRGRRHLAGNVQMAQVRAREVPAGVAATVRIRRQKVFRILRVLDRERPLTGEELAVPGVARRKDAVEEIDATCDAFDKVDRCR